MSNNSAIEWTEATWNPVTGCTRVSAGCDNCYAVRKSYRLERMGQDEKYGGLTVLNDKGDRHFNGVVKTHEDALRIPLERKKPTVYFVNSMSDLFHKDVPFEFIDKVFAVMNATEFQLPIPKDLTKVKRWHTYQVLTKRPDRMAEYMESRRTSKYTLTQGQHPLFKCRADVFTGHGSHLMNAGAVVRWPPNNVWLGTSVENQATADERIPHLLKCPAAVRFLSCEPLLGTVELPRRDDGGGDIPKEERGEWGLPAKTISTIDAPPGHAINWVIAGGESGPGARPCDIEWIRSIVSQCRSADVPVFVKQLGSEPAVHKDDIDKYGGVSYHHAVGDYFVKRLDDKKGGDPSEWPEDTRVREYPEVTNATG